MRAPVYPVLSRRRGETGTALVHVTVVRSGEIASVTLGQGSGFSRLDDAALAAVRESRSNPYIENGRPREVVADQPIVFKLDK